MLESVASRRGSRGDVELAVDRSQVPVDGARADDEVVSHLGIGEALGHQAQHFDLTGGQASWISG